MTERGRSALTQSAERLRIGPSGLRWVDGRLDIDFDEIAPPWPTSHWTPKRVRGQLRLDPGPISTETFEIDAAGRHAWRPAAASARVMLDVDGGPSWTGDGYLDSNWGTEALETRFRRWDWARGRFANGDAVILYDLAAREGDARRLALRIDRLGRVDRIAPPPSAPLGRGFWGVESAAPCEPPGTPQVLRKLEDAPFYRRSLIRTRILGEDVEMMHESLSGDRLARPLIKAMLPFRMPRRRSGDFGPTGDGRGVSRPSASERRPD